MDWQQGAAPDESVDGKGRISNPTIPVIPSSTISLQILGDNDSVEKDWLKRTVPPVGKMSGLRRYFPWVQSVRNSAVERKMSADFESNPNLAEVQATGEVDDLGRLKGYQVVNPGDEEEEDPLASGSVVAEEVEVVLQVEDHNPIQDYGLRRRGGQLRAEEGTCSALEEGEIRARPESVRDREAFLHAAVFSSVKAIPTLPKLSTSKAPLKLLHTTAAPPTIPHLITASSATPELFPVFFTCILARPVQELCVKLSATLFVSFAAVMRHLASEA
ncbi:hypothetical protein BT69DRAFT_1304404 [Atractiella rhizophila]|nr:hypothetical protein BT69DRAFT_1304404 [Atractiella rhizophila]